DFHVTGVQTCALPILFVAVEWQLFYIGPFPFNIFGSENLQDCLVFVNHSITLFSFYLKTLCEIGKPTIFGKYRIGRMITTSCQFKIIGFARSEERRVGKE